MFGLHRRRTRTPGHLVLWVFNSSKTYHSWIKITEEAAEGAEAAEAVEAAEGVEAEEVKEVAVIREVTRAWVCEVVRPIHIH